MILCSNDLIAIKEEHAMLITLVHHIQRFVGSTVQAIRHRVSRWTKPTNSTLGRSTVADLTRCKPELILENALLR